MGLDHSKASGKGSGDVGTEHDEADHAETKITTADITAAEKEKGSLDRKSDTDLGTGTGITVLRSSSDM